MTIKQDNNNKKDNKKKSFFSLLMGNLFGAKQELSIMEEEQVLSPFRTVINSFKSNKVAMFGFITFILIFLVVLIGPILHPIDLSFSEISQQNVAPGSDFLKFPKEFEGKLQDITVGPTFSIGLTTDGDMKIWGKTRISSTINMKKFPVDDKKKTIDMGKIVKVAAGHDHAIALNDKGELFGWGNDRQDQSTIPQELNGVTNIKDIYASYQNSVVLTEDGKSYYFGNSMNTDYNAYHPYQGQLDKLALTSDAVIGLTKDGEVVYLGNQGSNTYANLPENMGNVVDIAATASTVAALNDEGKVFTWGNITQRGENRVPETEDKIVKIEGGRYHYTGLTDKGNVLAWGSDNYKQSTVPAKVKSANIKEIHTGFYQNYAVTEEGKILTWGLKGYPLGTDELGRDIFTRLLNGGRMSMTIGGVAVIISTTIGVIVGSLSGYFGGKVDMVLQRISEVVAALPFLPFAMILSSLIGNSMDPDQKIFLIMVILGLLSWPGLQKLVRAQVLSVREQEYVIAAKALGIKEINIIFKHILPNVISVIIVSATLSFASSMLTESSLSYLGFGVQAPQPTWGNMLYGANNSIVIQNYWWRWVFASIVLGVCVICINLVGDGLRDAIDPKSQER